MTHPRSQRLAMAGLVALCALLLAPPDPAGAIAAGPLAVAVAAGLRAPARWGLPVAVVLLPYFAWGVMRVLTAGPGARAGPVAFAVLTVATFLAAMDSMRRA